MSETVKVIDLVNALQLEIITGDEEALQREIKISDISRPGLELTGYFTYYSYNRIQLFGSKEITFAQRMLPEERLMVMRRMCAPEIPAFVISRGLEVPKELIQAGDEAGIPVLRSSVSTSRLLGQLSSFLDSKLAVRESVHGVLVDVYGLGVLIQGSSGIGKSETALELIKRGHRLIADDRVDVYKQDDLTLIGEPPKILEHLIEIRGIGIIDVMNLFGASAVRGSMQVQLAVYLEAWEKDKKYDRLGSENATVEIGDVAIPQIRIPVKTGRNVAIIIEVAAMNFRAKTMGFDATKKFEERLSLLIAENSGK
ncbi:HPr(Ser) kinase/phosphatase [Enterococcus cecorum]|uniref:HPr kinase/phosphorylase n=1 Tax=Enterococcus cecorum TaxID=44008 RepID=A0A7X9NN25_9ENTE|nr:HPr(Ser) kinase/phosphatase [Enterococcus cecorum]MDT2797228.1 HPr(Ser) kinase/phosphatase [Enterococcus cecorum]MDZ5501492.1 HPr(Ser) kinase/phosphatase [Enterococcus cecorum]MDZ5507957.1 HPr(Ser) kinase/phosphatase [Enterococcus cecorum]MDZ5555358.1 HPr(Ser) kinase/phosphatase [Enterococcus cecorum]MDZ5557277.1 HPr(Ser) kinase/phosphatase [Enterococcus cecorum]